MLPGCFLLYWLEGSTQEAHIIAYSLVTQPMLQLRPNQTELRSMDYYHQIFCRFRKCKRKVPPPSPLSNDFEKSWVFFKIFRNDFFSKLTFLNSRWHFWNKNDYENMSRCHQIWNQRTTRKVMEANVIKPTFENFINKIFFKWLWFLFWGSNT